jgi:integrase/recombinase XerD
LEAYLENLMATGMASTSLLSRMRALAQALGALDRIADLTALRGLCARLKSKASPTRQKHKRLTSPALLIDRALASYDEIACDAGSLPVRACTNARDALMLAFLAYIPIRLANFTNLTIGQHIHFSHGGAQLRLAASETKEHRAYTCAINPELVRYLEHYLSAVRPVLLDGTLCNRLWISMQNGSMADSAVYYQINKVTKRLIGYQINPHLIRDCVMTELAERSPEHVHAGAKLLGHRDLRTSEDHYNHASTLSAQRTYFKWIEDVRAGRHPSEKST